MSFFYQWLPSRGETGVSIHAGRINFGDVRDFGPSTLPLPAPSPAVRASTRLLLDVAFLACARMVLSTYSDYIGRGLTLGPGAVSGGPGLGETSILDHQPPLMAISMLFLSNQRSKRSNGIGTSFSLNLLLQSCRASCTNPAAI